MLQQHYDRSDVRKRKAEAVARIIGKKKTSKISVDLENVDEWGEDAIKGEIKVANIALQINTLKNS